MSHRRPVRRLLTICPSLVTGLLVLAGCGSAEPVVTAEPGPETAGTAETAGSSGADAVQELLPGATEIDYDPAAVRGRTLSGGSYDASSADGPVVYWFWAPWCTVCRAESGGVAAAAGGEVTFVGVAGLGPQSDMEDFVAETGVDGFEHVRDDDGSVWASFGVVGQPSYVMVDADGRATLWAGALGAEKLQAVTAALAG